MQTQPRPFPREALGLLGRLAGLALALGAVGVASWVLARHHAGGEVLRFPWEALHRFVYAGQNPYHTLALLYGQALQDGVALTPEVYPFHTALLWFGPLALVNNFVTARALALSGAILASLATLAVAGKMFAWRPGKALSAWLGGFVLTWYFAAQALLSGNVTAVLPLLLLLAWSALRRERDALAGVLLAAAFIRPSLMVGVVVFVLLWSASRRRWGVWAGFWGLTIVLMAFSLWLLPSWPLDAARLAIQTRGSGVSPRALLVQALPGIGRQLGWLLVVGLGGLTLAEWVAAWGKPSHHALWTASLTVWSALLLAARLIPSDQVLLLVPLLLTWGYWLSRWKAYGRPAVWVTAGVLWLLPWLWFAPRWQLGAPTSPTLAMLFVPPLLVLPFLYTVRWWASRAHVLPLEDEMLS